MDELSITREEAIRRFKDSKKKKEEFLKKAVENVREEYFQRTGHYPKYIEVW